MAFRAPPLELVERESATATAPAAHLLARANRFIAQNATRGISARDVATHLGVTLFKRRFGLTMRAYRAQHSSRET